MVIHAGDIYTDAVLQPGEWPWWTDGKRSEAIVVMSACKQEGSQNKIAWAQAWVQPWKIRSRLMRPWEAKQVVWEEMERFLSGSGCRHYEDSEMDD